MFMFFSRSHFNGVRSRERCNKAWHYVIHLAVCVTVFLNSEVNFLLSLHLLDSND